ncbi:MAG: MFS transporter [Pseudopelagicola sp.]|nr:MFS transporter [Pseudopelagicola sp.]
MTQSYWRVMVFAVVPAVAGIPLYLHLPRYASTQLGLDLAVVAGLLLFLRVFDFAQDPLLGKLVEAYQAALPKLAALACLALGAGFVMVYAISPPFAPLAWLGMALLVLFTAFSLANILFYSQSITIAERREHLPKLAAWREVGSITGIILGAALLPIGALVFGDALAYPFFGVALAALILVAWIVSRPLWSLRAPQTPRLKFSELQRAGGARLLFLAFVNGLPVAITSTLFLFFVEDRLKLPGMAGIFLILFFLAAALSVPLWSRLMARAGARRALLWAMGLAILSFSGTVALPEGAAVMFAVICIASGAALGGDMVILPALFSARLDAAGLSATGAFGWWGASLKIALAIAAATTLPTLEWSGFQPEADNTAAALMTLTLLYTIFPCVLKIGAVLLVLRLPSHEVSL